MENHVERLFVQYVAKIMFVLMLTFLYGRHFCSVVCPHLGGQQGGDITILASSKLAKRGSEYGDDDEF